MKKRIGVFVCHCGLNIAASVDVAKVVEEIKKYPSVVHAEHYMYMCSDPGQDLVREAITEKQLDGIILSNCSPSLHERTFRNLAQSMGMNPYYCEIANIREHCSWPHLHDKENATLKAISIIKATVEKVSLNMALYPLVVPLLKRCMVVGGGMAGMQAALEIAKGGHEVILVEKSPALGGRVAQLSVTYPTLDRPACLLAPLIAEVLNHPKVTVYTNAEVEEVDGYVGNFVIKVRQKATFVDSDTCNLCGFCLPSCPAEVQSEFERGLATRKAIYIPSPYAALSKPIIDKESCLHFKDGSCRACEEACEVRAIDFSQEDSTLEVKVGAIVVATGHELYSKDEVKEYAKDPDIVDGLQFERLLVQASRNGGMVTRPSDGKVPREVVFIQCVGSRDPEHGMPYCSRVCCMYTAKQAFQYSRTIPDSQAYVFYIDIRSDAKGYEQFVRRAVEEERILYLRGRVSKVFRDKDKIKVWGVDTLTGNQIEVNADLVVLATAMIPSDGAKQLARKLNIIADGFGYMSEAHIKLRPAETLTAGIFLAGTAQAPRDITDTAFHAKGAASKVLSLFSRKELLHEPTIASVDEEICAGCGYCVSACTFKAVELNPRRNVAQVNEAVCEGCGACTIACPSKAIQIKNFSHKQLLRMVDVMAKEYALST